LKTFKTKRPDRTGIPSSQTNSYHLAPNWNRDNTDKDSELIMGVPEVVSDFIALRARIEEVEQDRSDAVHLLYCFFVWIATSSDSDFKQRTLGLLRAKFLQFPQGFRLGQALINIDQEFGSKLESHGVNLKRWVNEPRRRDG
jgi:hypothetical protein